MILGALMDAGTEVKFQPPFSKFELSHNLHISRVKRSGVTCTYVDVKLSKKEPHRSLAEIIKIIRKYPLAVKIFKRLAEAEAKVHGCSVNEVHFHEVGATDAIIDIVGTVICLEKLGITKVYASPLPRGNGTIKHSHGVLPIPAPATAELTKNVPTYATKVRGELVTPTGAAIITTIADFGLMPRMKIKKIGRGAGSKIYKEVPGYLQVFVGEEEFPTEKDTIVQIEANIDDMDPKLYDQAIAKMMKAGALDASVHPIRMKKLRDAVKLEVLCRPEDKEKLLEVIFTETTTIGVRTFLVERDKLFRTIINGQKVSTLGKVIKRIKEEYFS